MFLVLVGRLQMLRIFRELLTVKLLIPEIRELLEDEELQVRNSAVTVMLDISAILSIGKLILINHSNLYILYR